MNRPYRLSMLVLAAALATTPALPALAAPGAPAPAQTGAPAQPNHPPASLEVGGQALRLGEALPVVFGVVGPPDRVRAVRSKKEASDYVLFSYDSQGFALEISQGNQVKGILVESAEVSVKNVPFRVGDSKAAVLKAWGEPDRTQSSVLAYWRRGVYVTHDASGTVTNLFLAPPGKVEEPDKGPAPTGG